MIRWRKKNNSKWYIGALLVLPANYGVIGVIKISLPSFLLRRCANQKQMIIASSKNRFQNVEISIVDQWRYKAGTTNLQYCIYIQKTKEKQCLMSLSRVFVGLSFKSQGKKCKSDLRRRIFCMFFCTQKSFLCLFNVSGYQSVILTKNKIYQFILHSIPL